MKEKRESKLTIINLMIIVMIILFILDRYILFDRGELGNISLIIGGKNIGDSFSIALGLIPGKLTYMFGLYSNVFKTFEFWRIFTHIFFHVFIFHLLFNSIALYKVGNIVEKSLGKMKTLLLFLLSGPLTSLISNFLIYDEETLSIGISGTVFAFIGVCIILSFMEKGFIKNNFNKKWIAYFIFYGILLTISSSWTFVAHTSGLLIGIVVGLLLKQCLVLKKM